MLRHGLHTIFAQDSRVLKVYEVTNKEDLSACLISLQLDLIVVNQSLMIDISTLKASSFVILTSQPDMAALKHAYHGGALGYLSTHVSTELLYTFLNPSQKSFLIEPTLGPWIMETVSHVSRRLSNDQICTPRKSIRSVLPRRNNASRVMKYSSVTEKLILLILYLSR